VDLLATVAARRSTDESLIDPSSTVRPSDGTYAALLAWDFLVTLGLLSLLTAVDYGSEHASLWDGVGVAVTTALTIPLLGMLGAYEPATRLPGARLRTCGHLALVGCAAAVVAAFASNGFHGQSDMANLLFVVLALPTAWITGRIIVSVIERHHPSRTLVVGTGATARHVWELSMRHRECALDVIGFVDDEPLPLPPGAPTTLGSLSDLPRLVAERRVNRVIVAYANMPDSNLLAVLRALDGRVRVQVVPRLYDLVQARGFELGRISVLEAGGLKRNAGEHGLKRALDIIVGLTVLVLATPLLVLIAIAIKLDDGGPVLFRQRRVGKHCEAFEVLKFRTMAEDAEQHGQAFIQGKPIEAAVQELKSLSGERHVTRVGRLLRSKSLDELPQLWNVIRGDMGLVGPRPLREYEIEALEDWQVGARQAVRPGITGLWQVSGRSSVSWEERLHLDCAYARHWSLTSDLRILARTVAVVLHRSDTV
jgi:exopolysaccharide biosynthesis polyprenyl glycosylphosphotransferase